jgi:hypothetical protein
MRRWLWYLRLRYYAWRGYIICIDEQNMSRSQMAQYIDPIVEEQIDLFLADVLG